MLTLLGCIKTNEPRLAVNLMSTLKKKLDACILQFALTLGMYHSNLLFYIVYDFRNHRACQAINRD